MSSARVVSLLPAATEIVCALGARDFLASNRLVPNRNVIFNIARTYEQLERAPDAYRYYVQAAEGETDPAAKKRLEESIARITSQVAILRVETSPPGATIYLARKDLGPRGSAPRTLGPGSSAMTLYTPRCTSSARTPPRSAASRAGRRSRRGSTRSSSPRPATSPPSSRWTLSERAPFG